MIGRFGIGRNGKEYFHFVFLFTSYGSCYAAGFAEVTVLGVVGGYVLGKGFQKYLVFGIKLL